LNRLPVASRRHQCPDGSDEGDRLIEHQMMMCVRQFDKARSGRRHFPVERHHLRREQYRMLTPQQGERATDMSNSAPQCPDMRTLSLLVAMWVKAPMPAAVRPPLERSLTDKIQQP